MQHNSSPNAQHTIPITNTLTAENTGASGTSAVADAGTASEGAATSYSSWTVPSLDSLFSARRASAFGSRYGLIPSHAATLISGRTSPATSSMSLVLEGGAAGASLQSKARKASVHLSESITNVLNDSSLVFYRVNEHIHKKVPQLVEEKKALAAIHKDVKTANQDLEDARQTISGMQRITELSSIEALVERSLAAMQ